jgi:hypothetical protein
VFVVVYRTIYIFLIFEGRETVAASKEFGGLQLKGDVLYYCRDQTSPAIII